MYVLYSKINIPLIYRHDIYPINTSPFYIILDFIWERDFFFYKNHKNSTLSLKFIKIKPYWYHYTKIKTYIYLPNMHWIIFHFILFWTILWERDIFIKTLKNQPFFIKNISSLNFSTKKPYFKKLKSQYPTHFPIRPIFNKHLSILYYFGLYLREIYILYKKTSEIQPFLSNS